jgi:hypothetical protein
MTATIQSTATATTRASAAHDHSVSRSPLPYACCGLEKDFSAVEFFDNVGTRWYESTKG